ncbi:GNAT family N-acetyltransferase [Bacillus luteolus]|uniref:GNAT family N-acetyltransferase n=1 Tax=Litchfieldia luteola TaxID=682179 RepID=A0ABR9QNA7_9BACI|nr:GNAT family N-acetyltransferase [Cytobacillus luteolus]MBE4909990.1 GNAT family N-acetyltransferase [Cytobacillus luteolus]MBP1942450.1 GNAT superfamily N-acetyltransferase [Cytobacillus luteolus]
MNLKVYESPNEFLEKVEDFLLKEEVVNNLALGLLYTLTKPNSHYKDAFLACVEKNETPVLVMVMTPPHNLIVYGVGEDVNEAIGVAVTSIKDIGVILPGVLGPKALAAEFSGEWVQQIGCRLEVKMEQRIYKLEKVNNVPLSNGKLRLATKDDLELIVDWTYQFSLVTPEHLSIEGARKLAERGIEESSIFIWDDNGPVSMAKKARPTKNGIVVNLVFTPQEFQRKGYATTCVAYVSQQLLNEGYSFCSLYTDLANPTSNSIYMKIGYEPIIDSVVYGFLYDHEEA